MGMHTNTLNGLASAEQALDRVAKAFKDFNNPQPAAKPIKKSASEAAFDELDQALAVLKKGDNKSAVPETVAKATKARPQVHIREALGDQSLGIQDAGLAKAAENVDLYGSLASAGTVESANAKVAKAVNGQAISKAEDDEDEDDPIGGIQI